MNGTNGRAIVEGAAALAALPAANVTLAPEAAASVTVRLAYRGRDVMLTLRGSTGGEVLSRLDVALTWLDAQGLTSTPAPALASSTAAEHAPTCPTHGRPMKQGRKGGWFCPAKVAEDDGAGRPVYCRQRVNGGAS